MNIYHLMSSDRNNRKNQFVFIVDPSSLKSNSTFCDLYNSSCHNCSQHMECAWCFSDNSCFPWQLRNHHGICHEDNWCRGECIIPHRKSEVMFYVLLILLLFLLIIVILLVSHNYCPRVLQNNKDKSAARSVDYEPVSSKEETIPVGNAIMTKEAIQWSSRTEELRKKYQLFE